MRLLIAVCISMLIASSAHSEDLTKTDLYTKSEPAELFFNPSKDPNNFNWYPSNACCPEKSPIIHGPSFSKSIVNYKLRPIDANLEIPINSIHMINKIYGVWARTIWDRVFLEVLYPNFEGKKENNLDLFSSRTSSNLIKIRIGGLGDSSDFEYLQKRIETGEIIQVTNELDKKLGLQEFQYAKIVNRTSYYIVDGSILRSLSGKAIVMQCSAWPSLGELTQRCEVNLNFPVRFWPAQMHSSFGGTDGLQVQYSFPKARLTEWKDILLKTQNYTAKLFPELSPEASNLLNLNEPRAPK